MKEPSALKAPLFAQGLWRSFSAPLSDGPKPLDIAEWWFHDADPSYVSDGISVMRHCSGTAALVGQLLLAKGS